MFADPQHVGTFVDFDDTAVEPLRDDVIRKRGRPQRGCIKRCRAFIRGHAVDVLDRQSCRFCNVLQLVRRLERQLVEFAQLDPELLLGGPFAQSSHDLRSHFIKRREIDQSQLRRL